MSVRISALSKFQQNFPACTTEVDFPGVMLLEFMVWVKTEFGLDEQKK